MIAPLVWQVIAVDGSGRGHGTCGHRHATPDDATMCPWTPTPWPNVCDLLVREMRDPEHRTPGQLMRAAQLSAQLELELGAD